MASDIDEAKPAPGGPAPEEAADRPGGWADRFHLWALVELFVLSGFAIAQPLLDVTGRSPDFFLFRRADRLDIIALVLGVILLPTLFIWGFEVAVGLVSGFYRLGISGMRSIGGKLGEAELRAAFIHTLVPIAAVYVAAHYFSFLIYEGQAR